MAELFFNIPEHMTENTKASLTIITDIMTSAYMTSHPEFAAFGQGAWDIARVGIRLRVFSQPDEHGVRIVRPLVSYSLFPHVMAALFQAVWRGMLGRRLAKHELLMYQLTALRRKDPVGGSAKDRLPQVVLRLIGTYVVNK